MALLLPVMLRHESQRAGRAWEESPFLDILVPAVALMDDRRNDKLEGLTDYLGVDVHDRNTALGGSLMEAETRVAEAACRRDQLSAFPRLCTSMATARARRAPHLSGPLGAAAHTGRSGTTRAHQPENGYTQLNQV